MLPYNIDIMSTATIALQLLGLWLTKALTTLQYSTL